MSSRWNFGQKQNGYKPLDTKKLEQELGTHSIQTASRPVYRPHYYDDSPKIGVRLHFIDGSKFKTQEYTVEDIHDALEIDKKRWLELNNGGAINLGYVIRYEHWDFQAEARRNYADRNVTKNRGYEY